MVTPLWLAPYFACLAIGVGIGGVAMALIDDAAERAERLRRG